MNTLILVGMVMGSSVGLWATELKVDEVMLSDLSRQDSPTRQKISAGRAAGELTRQQVRQNFETRTNLKYSYSDTEEDSLTVFAPEFGPSESISLGLAKKTPLGLSLGATVFGTQLSTVDRSIVDATRAGANVNLGLDLWKNLFGRIDRAQLRSAAAQEKRSRLESEIQLKALELNVRKIYWSMVAIEESIKVSDGLLKTAQTQLRDAKRKLRAGATGRGDLARNQAQVDSRRASITQLKYQKELQLSQLRSLLPQLRSFDVRLKPVDFEKTIGDVVVCIDEISSSKELSLASTKWAGVIEILKYKYKSDIVSLDRTSSPSVNLNYQAQISGVDNTYNRAFEGAESDQKTGHELGVAISIPIGGVSKAVERKQKALTRYTYESEKQNIETEILETHRRVLMSLKLLNEALKSQESSNLSLEKSVKEAQRKYRQARISVNSLVLEQDALLSSTLQEIDIKLAVIHTLMDYFKVFTEHPCKINNLRSA